MLVDAAFGQLIHSCMESCTASSHLIVLTVVRLQLEFSVHLNLKGTFPTNFHQSASPG